MKGPQPIRTILWQKQGGRCCYCDCDMLPTAPPKKGKLPDPRMATREHLKRIIDGGTHHPDNLALSCFECNSGRGLVDWFTYKTYRMGELWEVA